MKIAPNAGNRAGLLIGQTLFSSSAHFSRSPSPLSVSTAFYAILCLNGIAVLIYGLLIRNSQSLPLSCSALVGLTSIHLAHSQSEVERSRTSR